jgi:hypothetical protein
MRAGDVPRELRMRPGYATGRRQSRPVLGVRREPARQRLRGHAVGAEQVDRPLRVRDRVARVADVGDDQRPAERPTERVAPARARRAAGPPGSTSMSSFCRHVDVALTGGCPAAAG